MITAEELVKSITLNDGGSDVTKLATVVSLFASGKPKLKFDGEDVASGKEYEVLGSYSPKIGDRLLLLRASGTWVILGSLGLKDNGNPNTGFKNMVVDGYFRHTGGPDAESGVGFFGVPPARQRSTTMVPDNANLSTAITHINYIYGALKSWGLYR